MNAQSFFKRNPVFRKEEFVVFLEGRGKYKKTNCDSMLSYYTSKGHVVNLRRGIYASVPDNLRGRYCSVDPFQLCSKLTEDAVLSHHTAMQFHGVAYSEHFRFPYMTAKQSKHFRFRDILFTPVASTEGPTKHRLPMGVELIDHLGVEVRVTNQERMVVDAMDRPNLCGGWEEIWRSLALLESCNFERIVDYTLVRNNSSLVSKVGFFLDQHRDQLMVPSVILDEMQRNVPRNPCYMDRQRRANGKLVHPWNLMVSEDVLRRTWEESLELVA